MRQLHYVCVAQLFLFSIVIAQRVAPGVNPAQYVSLKKYIFNNIVLHVEIRH